MRRHPAPARLIAAALAGLLAVAAQVVPQRMAGALDPAPADVLVGAALAAVGVLVARRTRPTPALGLGLAAGVWIVVGGAAALGGPLRDPLLRIALLPHALVVVALLTVPSGRLSGRGRVLAAAALVVALLAGTGRMPLPLAAVGVVAIIGALPPRDAPVAAARAVFGALLVLVSAGSAVGLLPASATATTVDVTLIAAAAVLPRLLDRETALWDAAADAGDLIGARLGRALQTGPLTVAVPAAGGGFVSPAGLPTEPPAEHLEVRSGDRLVAVLAPPAQLDAALRPAVAAVLGHVARIARARATERTLVSDLAASRRLLLRAGDVERRNLEANVATVVGGRIGEVRERLAAVDGWSGLAERADAARDELLRVGAAPPLGDPDALAAALDRLVGHRGRVDLDLRTGVPEPLAEVLWFACAEGLANATKHAPAARIDVTMTSGPDGCGVVVADDGPGGADPHGPGLAGLADRATVAGGTLTVDSSDAGTRLTVLLPAALREIPAVAPADPRRPSQP